MTFQFLQVSAKIWNSCGQEKTGIFENDKYFKFVPVSY